MKSLSQQSRYATLIGIGLMLFGCFASGANSALAKGLLFTYPLVQVLFIRSASALVLSAPFMSLAALRAAPRRWLQLVRFILCGVEVVLYFLSIAFLPLIDVMTFYLAGPIYVTALSPFLLGERVGWRRWTAVFAGFIGVLIALRPSEALLSWPALIALIGSILYAFILIITRVLRGTTDSVLLLSQVLSILLVAAVAVPFYWIAPTVQDAVLMCCIGAGTLAIALSINRSLKLAPASVVVPYQYTLLLWGGVFGYVMFDEKPAATTLVGAAIIVAAGVYIFVRETKRQREEPFAPPQ